MSFFTPSQASDFLPKAYNSFAKDFSSTRHYQWKEFDQLSKGLNSENTHSEKYILDLGCGNGRLNKFLRGENSNNISFEGTYIGFDISEKLLEEAKKNNTYKNTEFINAGFLDFPQFLPKEAKNNVSQIWAVASFHHLSTIEERKKTLQNIYTSLEENGEFVFTVWNLWEQEKYTPQKKEALWRARLNPLWNTRDFIIPFGQQKTKRYYYSFEETELHTLLEEAGFTIIDSFYSEKKQNLCIRAKKIINPLFPAPVFKCQNLYFHKTTLEKIIAQINFFRKNTEIKAIKTVVTPNPEMIIECIKNKKFEKILQNADISLADGNGILWASGLDFLQHKPLFWKYTLGIGMLFWFLLYKKKYPSKIKQPLCGSDLFREYLNAENIQTENNHIFLLGGSAGSAEYIKNKYTNCIADFYDKKVTLNISSDQNKSLLEQIKKSHADVLFVALGAPKQELWIAENKQFLEENTAIKVCIGVGGSFDFISGYQKRAPLIFQKLGLEWVYRLYTEPKRWKRIWNATGKFIHKVLSK